MASEIIEALAVSLPEFHDGEPTQAVSVKENKESVLPEGFVDVLEEMSVDELHEIRHELALESEKIHPFRRVGKLVVNGDPSQFKRSTMLSLEDIEQGTVIEVGRY